MTYSLYRIEDDETTTFVAEYPSIGDGIAAGNRVVSTEDYDYAYCLHTEDDIRVSTFGRGRIGYRAWAMRTGRLSPSVEDRYDRDEDEWVS